tara:strand:+ start:423 stop:1622 length:1200 start_codon:yes stop_codon:yes gene_type:complete
MKNIREQFPLLKNDPSLVYLDSAATTLKPSSVVKSISNYYENYSANIHRSVYRIADKATDQYEKARAKIAKFINAPTDKSIILTSGATESINLVANSLCGNFLNHNDEILITEMEHHSNNVPWQMIASKIGAKLKYIPINIDGSLDLSTIDFLLTSKTKIVSVIHQSNVFGTINPIEILIKKAHSVGSLILVDAAQSISHSNIDVKKLDCDFLAFSGHKMFGPTGIGVLFGKTELLSKMQPFMGGGEMISSVSMESVTYNDLPWKFEAGTPNIAQGIGLGAAIDFINQVGIKKINNYCNELRDYAFSELKKIDGLIIYGDNIEKGPVISFNIDKVNSHDMAQLLDQFNICIRSGSHCSEPIMKKLEISSVARISFNIYNQIADIDALITGIKKVKKLLS